MSDEKAVPSKRVTRPPASAMWEHEHRWGNLIGDTTILRVIRTDGGSMTVSYGKESVGIRESLVAVFAQMVAAAAEWSDTPPASTDETGGQR